MIFFIRRLNILFFSLLAIFFINTNVIAQNPLFSQVLVSDTGSNNSIGSASTSRNIGVDGNGVIYVVYLNTNEIRVSKSIDRGENFVPSINIGSADSSPEIAVTEEGVVYLSWILDNTVFFSRSLDGAETFSTPVSLGPGIGSTHLSFFEDNIYIVDEVGVNAYANNAGGVGSFVMFGLGQRDFFADVLIDQNGTPYIPSDDPTLALFRSDDEGETYIEQDLIYVGNSRDSFFSSFALSESPSGSFIFIGGGGASVTTEVGNDTIGYKIDINTLQTEEIMFGQNNVARGRTLFADNLGALIDGYSSSNGELFISLSPDQGNTFDTPILIANGISHNIGRNPLYDDVNVVYNQGGQIFLNVYEGLLLSVRIESQILCSGSTMDFPYVLRGTTFEPNGEFLAFLSDETGSFENKTLIGQVNSNVSGNIEVTIPDDIELGDNYRIQIESEDNFIQSNVVDISIQGAPITAEEPEDLFECENVLGEATFDLTTQDNVIQNTLANTVVTYHLSEEDAEENIDAITNADMYVTDEEVTIWARLTTDATLFCEVFDVVNFNLTIGRVELTIPSLLSACNNGKGLRYDLTVREDEISTEEGISFSYFEDQLSLNSGSEIIDPTDYLNSTSITSVLVLLEDVDGCTNMTSLDLMEDTREVFNETLDVINVCDINNDDVESFDLTINENTILNGLVPVADYMFEYYENEADANIDDTSIRNQNIILNPSIYTNTALSQELYVRVQNINSTCFTVIPFDIIVEPTPEVDLEQNYVLCIDSSSTIVPGLVSTEGLPVPIETNLNETDYSFQWYTGLVVDPLNLIAGETFNSFAPDQIGNYTVEVIDVLTQCSTVASTEVLGSQPPISISAEVLSEPFSNDNRIEVTVVGGGEYEFRIDEGDWVSNNIFSNISGGEHLLEVRDIFGCNILGTTEVIIDFPRFFTPNGDGQNDVWRVEDVGVPNSLNVFIYDRFGKLIGQLDALSPSWDGNFIGNPLPSDDYWFLLEYTDDQTLTQKSIKSHFSLIR